MLQTDNSHLFLKDTLDTNELKLKRLRISKKDENDHMSIMNNWWEHIIWKAIKKEHIKMFWRSAYKLMVWVYNIFFTTGFNWYWKQECLHNCCTNIKELRNFKRIKPNIQIQFHLIYQLISIAKGGSLYLLYLNGQAI